MDIVASYNKIATSLAKAHSNNNGTFTIQDVCELKHSLDVVREFIEKSNQKISDLGKEITNSNQKISDLNNEITKLNQQIIELEKSIPT